MSASSWGCELKCYKYIIPHLLLNVSLLVRLWVEMLNTLENTELSTSASSWGCELKCIKNCHHITPLSQPPREAVSWNKPINSDLGYNIRQPPREAVSWNTGNCRTCFTYTVSLLVRLWVEIRISPRLANSSQPSASSWGCELKWFETNLMWVMSCQPPREAVSWNEPRNAKKTKGTVSLLVRLWVEMLYRACSWWWNNVSLLVRLWVEISLLIVI